MTIAGVIKEHQMTIAGVIDEHQMTIAGVIGMTILGVFAA